MANEWQPDERSGITLHIPALAAPLIALVAVGALVWAVGLQQQTRRLRRQVTTMTETVSASTGRERELEETIARQHQQLSAAEGDLEAIRLQIESIEMQLDGVDALNRAIRQDLGLPDEAATRSEGPEATPQGGAWDPTLPSGDRLALIQERLARGLAELYGLRDAARQTAESGTGATFTGMAQANVEPANWPARGAVTSDYGWRLFRGRPGFHSGIDVALDPGTAVVATADGTSIGSGWQPGYGWCVLLQHEGGYNTLYSHLSELWVRLGTEVRQGDIVGLSGNSGNSTGPHLHYEIWRDGAPIDPRPSMDVGGTR